MSSEVYAALFRHVVDREQDRLDLASAVLMLGQIEYSSIEIGDYLETLNSWTEDIRSKAKNGSGSSELFSALRTVLFDDIGIRGDDDDYFDLRNGFLHQVMDRKLGIPLSLAVLVLIVGLRLGLQFDVLGKAGNFFIRHVDGDSTIVIDPDDRGATVEKEELIELFGSENPNASEFGIKDRQLLRRMLTHLGLLYGRLREDQKHLEVIEHLLTMDRGDNTILANLREHLVQKLKKVN